MTPGSAPPKCAPERPLADLDWPPPPFWMRCVTVALAVFAFALGFATTLPPGLRALFAAPDAALRDTSYVLLDLMVFSIPVGHLVAAWRYPRQRRVMVVVLALVALFSTVSILSLVGGGLPSWLADPLRSASIYVDSRMR